MGGRQIVRYEDKPAFFWAVPCHHCSFMLPQARIKFDKKHAPTPKVPETFEAVCRVCLRKGQYRRDQVVEWLGVSPIGVRLKGNNPALR
jgi:hypothetical protein